MASLKSMYDDLMEQEMQKFPVFEDKLENAKDDLREVYSKNSLHSGLTYMDYNNPHNRLAYLRRFGAVHADMTIQYFQLLLMQPSVFKVLDSKPTLKICALGGGPGPDVAATFITLAARYPDSSGKIENVTILDICGGWRNSFKELIQYLIIGRVPYVPESFVDLDEFNYQLVQVDLLQPLPKHISDIISEADVVTMVKFMSAVAGNHQAGRAFKNIGNALKPGSVLLMIDNKFVEKDYRFLRKFRNSCGLQTVLGPINDSFSNLKVSILGLIKGKATDVQHTYVELSDSFTDTYEDGINSRRRRRRSSGQKDPYRNHKLSVGVLIVIIIIVFFTLWKHL